MRRLALCILLLAPMAHAGESPPYATAPKAAQEMWMACRLSIAKPDRPMGSQDVVVYTTATPRPPQVNESDVRLAFSAFVEKTYGVRGTVDCASTNSEAQAQQSLDFWTTNKAYPQQFTVVKTGWTYQAPDV